MEKMVQRVMKSVRLLFIIPICLFTIISCKQDKPVKTDDEIVDVIKAPEFSSDKAYEFIEQQVAFGPRVPGTEEHAKCASWLSEKLSEFGAKVTVQEGTLKRHDNAELPMYNIIGSYNPSFGKKIIALRSLGY